MKRKEISKRLAKLFKNHEALLTRQNKKIKKDFNGIYYRYKFPILTGSHMPLHWRYDLNPASNPFMMERMGINAAFNAGAIYLNKTFYQIVRVEGWDRKSFFAVSESPNGIDNWRFWDYPVTMPLTDEPETNVYDMRIVKHEDGWIYGIFCAERRDPNARPSDLCAVITSAGIARTKDLKNWERLPDLKTKTQQKNVVLHPEFVNGKYALYTTPLEGFIDADLAEGIGWVLTDTMIGAEIKDDAKIIDERIYHTIKEVRNGLGPAPIKTEKGWLHIAHGVHAHTTGLRCVLYMFLTDLEDPSKVVAKPGGYFMAPEDEERIGNVSNVLFANGWIQKKGEVYIYYSSSDTRMHVATTTVDRLLDCVLNTPADGLISAECVKTRNELISKNLEFLRSKS